MGLSLKADGKIVTQWELRSYDVWGNARDGWEVNNTFNAGTAEITLAVEVNNAGTDMEFRSAFPTDSQIRKACGLGRVNIETDGDDLTIYVNRSRDGYPLGELHCVSHESLSPIRELGEAEHTETDAADSDGMTAADYQDEDNITTEDDVNFYQYGRLVFTLDPEEDRNAGIRRELDRMQFWPNVLSISDHGNACLIVYWQ